ncbi:MULTISPECIES: rhodanese-like domain-containing protein [Planococcus]|uniref:Rhodanese-like domain-containing protein n=1 Tax=Planococcus wigleyi TaxID=2762216 RepID=A0ABR8WCI3_9BACL|nr:MULTISPECIES: rhodanese-like domain-containing protein [Planococcus]MBD8014733.1 rhodanese-like domain-containing protein [Planococcus wigleyi]MDN3436959.1 rhodanese-like domain-containing protein [Planococcus sp. APC 3900]
MKTMTTQQVRELVESKQTINLIDVRETNEVAAGKIPGAINIPLGLLEFRMNELDKSKEYIMVCRSGGRSGQATSFLENQGYKVTNMDGGMLDWNGETN